MSRIGDINYTVGADASGLGKQLTGAVVSAARQAERPLAALEQRARELEQMSARVNREVLPIQTRALMERELQQRAAMERRFATESVLYARQAEEAQESLGQRIQRVNRTAMPYLRVAAAGLAGVAASAKIAVDSAERYDRRFTEAGSSTAAMSRAVRELRVELDASLQPAVKMADSMSASMIRGATNTLRFRDAMMSFVMTGGSGEAYLARLQDENAAVDASVENRMSRIGLANQGAMAGARGDSIGAMEIAQRIQMRDLATSLSGQLRKGEITPGEMNAMLDGARQAGDLAIARAKHDEAMRAAIENAAALGQAERDEMERHRKNEEERLDYLDARAARLERSQRERESERDRQRGAFRGLDDSLRGLEGQTALEQAKAEEMRLRNAGNDRGADEVRIRAVYQAEIAGMRDRVAALVERAQSEGLLPGDQAYMQQRATETMAALQRALEMQRDQELGALDAETARQAEEARMRAAGTGAGLVVGSGVGSDMAGRVFGAASPAVREAEKQTRKLDEINTTLKEIREKTGGAVWN
jgi:hypothetical protein